MVKHAKKQPYYFPHLVKRDITNLLKGALFPTAYTSNGYSFIEASGSIDCRSGGEGGMAEMSGSSCHSKL